MEKSNKRTLETISGKSSKQSNLKEQTSKSNRSKMKNKMERSQWKEFDNKNNTWKIFHIPKLNKEGQLYVEKINKEPEAIIEEEWIEVENKCSNISKSTGVALADDNPLFLWLIEVQSVPNISRRFRKNNRLFQLGIKLMATPTTSLPGVVESKKFWTLPHKHCTLAWIAFIEKFGLYIPAPTPICYKDQILPIKEWGELILAQSITKMIEDLFDRQNILTQGNKGAHDICQWAMNKKMGSDSSSIPWENTIINLWDSENRSENEENLLSVLIRLGKTPPQCMPGWNKDTGLPFSTVNLAWVAAQLKFGNLWREKKEIPASKEINGNINRFFKPINHSNNETSQKTLPPHDTEIQDSSSKVPMEGITITNSSSDTNLPDNKLETKLITPDAEPLNDNESIKWRNNLIDGNQVSGKLSMDIESTTEYQKDYSLKDNPSKNKRTLTPL